MAPEVLRGNRYTQAVDIYSFGIVAYEIVSGLPPYHQLAHNDFLALKICLGLRPELNNIKLPQLLKDLINRCLDADPLIRPTASELCEILNGWYNEVMARKDTEFYSQYIEIKKAEKFNKKSNDVTSHPQAIYTSRLLTFKNLPEPQNSKEINYQFYAEYSKSL